METVIKRAHFLLALGGCVRVMVVMCVSVTALAVTFIRLYIENKVPLRFLWHFQDMHCVAFIENALFKSLATLADHLCLLRFLTSSQRTKETAMASFHED